MAKKKRKRGSRNGPLLQIGAPKDSIKVLATLDAALQQAVLMGREATAQEIARQIGNLGGVQGVIVTNSTFTG